MAPKATWLETYSLKYAFCRRSPTLRLSSGSWRTCGSRRRSSGEPAAGPAAAGGFFPSSANSRPTLHSTSARCEQAQAPAREARSAAQRSAARVTMGLATLGAGSWRRPARRSGSAARGTATYPRSSAPRRTREATRCEGEKGSLGPSRGPGAGAPGRQPSCRRQSRQRRLCLPPPLTCAGPPTSVGR